MNWWEDCGWPNEVRANYGGRCYHTYRNDGERTFWLLIHGRGMRHRSPHRTRKAAKQLAEAIAKEIKR